MRRSLTLIFVGLLLAGCAFGGSVTPPEKASGVAAAGVAEPGPVRRAPADGGAHMDRFYDAASFHKGLEAVRKSPPPAREGALLGGVVPHHNLAGAMFCTFFLRLEARPPQTVIVVGPNHEHRGQRILTGRRGWATAFGVVEADTVLVEWLAAAGLATVDDPSLELEHSIGALMPYLKYHAPGARVVPIVLHRDVTIAEQEQLAAFLAPLLSADTLLVASVDFSHYLPRAQAEANDLVTRQAILAFDLPALMRMGPDYVDSPGSLGVLMLTMRHLRARGPVEEAHTNSGVILGSDVMETTSYFTFSYWQQP